MSPSAPGPPYVRRRYLLTWWEGETFFKNQLLVLKKVLDTSYRMQGETYEIPTGKQKDKTTDVGDRLKAFKDRHKGNELLIVVYGGHGKCPDTRRPSLRWTTKGGYRVEWNGLQNRILFPGEKDTFVVLDCCYASAATREDQEARKDILAACSYTETAPEYVGSLTAFFIEVLKRPVFPMKPEMIYLEIQRRIPEDEVSPVYYFLPEDPDHDIDLYPPDGPGGGFNSGGGGGGAATDTMQNGNTQWNICIEIVLPWPISSKIRVCRGHLHPDQTNQTHQGQTTVAGGQAQQVGEILECTQFTKNSFYQPQTARFYEIGRVFAVPWSNQTLPPNVVGAPTSSAVSNKEERVFVVIGTDTGSCLALPMFAEQGVGGRSDSMVGREQGIVFSGGNAPTSTSSMRRITVQSIRAELNDREERLAPEACLTYDAISKVSFGVPVRSLGRIHNNSRETFFDNYRSAQSRSSSQRTKPTGNRQPASDAVGFDPSNPTIMQLRPAPEQQSQPASRNAAAGAPTTATMQHRAAPAQPTQRASPSVAQGPPLSATAAVRRAPAGSSQRTSSTTAAATPNPSSAQVSTDPLNIYISQMKARGYSNEQIMNALAQQYVARGYSREQALPAARSAVNQQATNVEPQALYQATESDEDGSDEDDDDEDSD